MEEMLYNIVLEDGTKIENLRMNGNNFISEEELTEDIFDGNLSNVIISDGETEETHEHMMLASLREIDMEYWFALIDIPKSQITMDKIRSDIDYLSMVSGIEL